MKSELVKQIGQDYRKAFMNVKEKRLAVVKAGELSKLLPEAITETDWYTLYKRYDGVWWLETSLLDKEEADRLIRECKLFGIQGITSSFNTYNQRWKYRAEFTLGKSTIILLVDGGSPPEDCRIEEKREWKEVITYEAICEKTGEKAQRGSSS